MSDAANVQTGSGTPPGNKDRQQNIEAEIEQEIDEAAGDTTSSAGEEDPGSAAEDFAVEHLKKKQEGKLSH